MVKQNGGAGFHGELEIGQPIHPKVGKVQAIQIASRNLNLI